MILQGSREEAQRVEKLTAAVVGRTEDMVTTVEVPRTPPTDRVGRAAAQGQRIRQSDDGSGHGQRTARWWRTSSACCWRWETHHHETALTEVVSVRSSSMLRSSGWPRGHFHQQRLSCLGTHALASNAG